MPGGVERNARRAVPLGETATLALSLDAHVTLAPAMTSPRAFLTVAVRDSVCPAAVSVARVSFSRSSTAFMRDQCDQTEAQMS